MGGKGAGKAAAAAGAGAPEDLDRGVGNDNDSLGYGQSQGLLSYSAIMYNCSSGVKLALGQDDRTAAQRTLVLNFYGLVLSHPGSQVLLRVMKKDDAGNTEQEVVPLSANSDLGAVCARMLGKVGCLSVICYCSGRSLVVEAMFVFVNIVGLNLGFAGIDSGIGVVMPPPVARRRRVTQKVPH